MANNKDSVIRVAGEAGCRKGGVSVNLRPDGRGGVTVVGEPRPLADVAEGVRPLAELSGGDLLVAVGRQLSVVGADGSVAGIGEAAGDIYCAVWSGGIATVMTSAGPGRLVRSGGSWQWLGVMPQWPELHFSARECGKVSGRIAPVEFRENYDTDTQRLAPVDETALGQAMAKGYLALDRDALGAGAMVQPLLMRYKLRDAAGRVLYVSSPVMVGSAQGWQCAELMRIPLRGNSLDLQGTGTVRVEAAAWRPVVGLPAIPAGISPAARAWLAQVAEAEVTVSAPVHPVTEGSPAYRLALREDAGSVMEAFMPGTSRGMSPDTRDAARRLRALGAMMDEREVTAARIRRPFASSAREVEVERPVESRVWRMWPQEVTEVAREWAESRRDIYMARCRAPHSMTARCAAAGGNTVVWGGIAPLAWQGPGLAALSVGEAGAGERVRRAWTRVSLLMDDGSEMTVARIDEAPERASLSLSGYVYYPDPRALSVAVMAEDEHGGIHTRRIDLAPTPGGTGASWISDDGCAVRLTAQPGAEWALPGTAGVQEPWPERALMAPAADMLAPVSSAPAGGGEIRGVTAAWGAHAGWDFGCGRYYLLTSAGAYAFTAGKSGEGACCSMVDPRECQGAAVLTPQGVYALMAGGVVRLAATKGTDVDINGLAADAALIGWEPRRGELWVVDGDGNVTVAIPDSGLRYTRRGAPTGSLLTCAARLIAVRGGRLLDASDEMASDDVYVEWRASADVPAAARVRAVEWNLRSAAMEGLLSLESESGAAMLRLRVEGPVRRPLRVVVAAPARSGLSLSVKGAGAAGTVMAGAALRDR